MAKIQIRRGVWETNSSSVHTLTMVSKSDFKSWEDGDLVYDERNGQFISRRDVKEEGIFNGKEYNALLEKGSINESYDYRRNHGYYDYDSFFSYGTADYLSNYCEDGIVDGVEVVAFGEYGDNY